jgi:hypothetical protein
MELVLTVLGLLVAVYAVVPRERRLDLRLRISTLERAIILVGFLAIVYLEFDTFFLVHGLNLIPRPWPEGITSKNAAYLITIAIATMVGFRIRYARLTKRQIYRFQELVEELYWSERYGELIALLQRHLKAFFRIYGSESALARLRRRIDLLSRGMPLDLQAFPPNVNGIETSDVILRSRTPISERVLRGFVQWAPAIVNALPTYDREQQTARDIARAVFLSPTFIRALTRTRPYFALAIIGQSPPSFPERFEFVDIYLKECLREPNTVLYSELKNNQNIYTRYYIPESNRLLHFFLTDVQVAKDNQVYKPLGDFAMSYLDELAHNHSTDPYNRATGDFREVGAWHSPLFATIRFFDIMVREALFLGMEWHMWLYYMPHIVERMVRNYKLIDPLAEPEAEWPIRYSFLLYEIFSSMSDWVTDAEEVPADQPNIVLRSTNTNHENGNIPKSSILALSQCCRSLLESQDVGDTFKRYLMDIVFELYFELRSSHKLEQYAMVLRSAISQGGFYSRKSDDAYRSALIVAFEWNKTEYSIKHSDEHVSELESALSGE